MERILNRKWATHCLYSALAHASDLIQARGMKRFFEYHSLKNEAEVICLQRRMANRRWKSAFPDINEGIKLLQEYQVDRFKSITPNTVNNDTYVTTIKNLIESCLKHEKNTLVLLNDEIKHCNIEDFDVIEDFAKETDCVCKELMRLITCYNKYNWKSEYIENLQVQLHDHYEGKTKETFHMDFC